MNYYDINNARKKYYSDKQEACIGDLAKAHIKVYEHHMGRRFEDQEELELFERIYNLIKGTLSTKGLI